MITRKRNFAVLLCAVLCAIVAGLWACLPALTASAEEPPAAENTRFYQVTKASQVREGAHLMFVGEWPRKALAPGEDGFMADISALKNNAVAYDENGEYSIRCDVPTDQLSTAPYVMTCTAAGAPSFNGSETSVYGCKIKTNVKDAASGKPLCLKMGTSKSSVQKDPRADVFSTSAGSVDFRFDNSASSFRCSGISHSGYAYLRYDHAAPEFLLATSQPNIFGQYGGEIWDEIRVLSDVPPQDDEPQLQGDVEVEHFNALDLLNTSYSNPNASTVMKNGLAIVVKDGDDYYALTSNDGQDHTVKVAPPDENGKLTIDTAYLWKPDSLPAYKNEQTTAGNMLEYITMQSGLKQDGKYLWLSNGGWTSTNAKSARFMFLDHPQGDYSKRPLEDPFLRGNGDQQYLGWDSENKVFTRHNSLNDGACQVMLFSVKTEEGDTSGPFYRTTDLSQIKDWGNVLITATGTDGKTYPVQFDWGRYGIEFLGAFEDAEKDENGNYTEHWNYGYLPATMAFSDGLPHIDAFDQTALQLGKVTSTNKAGTRYEVRHLGFNSSILYFYPDGLLGDESRSSDKIVDSSPKEVGFYYDDLEQNIYLRGLNANTDNWLVRRVRSSDQGFDPGQGFDITSRDNASPIQIWVRGDVNKPAYSVRFHNDARDGVETEYQTQSNITLYRKNGVEKDGKTYAFLGWSTDPKTPTFLSLDESCDLYDFDDTSTTASVKDALKKKYSLVSKDNPDVRETADPAKLADGSNRVDLYPVYMVRGFSSAVTADEANGKKVVAISDWKPNQGETGYNDPEREQWLGKINVEVYKDGKLWGDSQPMYFRYHNDDAADLNLKFVWEDLLAKYQDEEDPLYAYSSDESMFPATSEDGHYVMDAVVADQGGSEDGLRYSYNWLKQNGGQLDNVKGGSTVKVYVTTVYQVEYFLNDVELGTKQNDKAVKDNPWHNACFYATNGTEKAVDAASEKSDYRVTMDNDLKQLMNGSIKDASSFEDDNMKRGDYSRFTYFLNEYPHEFVQPKLADAPKGEKLTTNRWVMKNADRAAVGEYAAGSSFTVASGNVNLAWNDGEDDLVDTYHLYLYSAKSEEPADPNGGAGGSQGGDSSDDGSNDGNSNDDSQTGEKTGATASSTAKSSSKSAAKNDRADKSAAGPLSTGDGMLLSFAAVLLAAIAAAGIVVSRRPRRRK